MGYKTREFESRPLTSRYPAYYKEMQILNYSFVDVVITHPDGKQTTVPKWDHAATASNKVVIQVREATGLRSETTRLGIKELPIHTTEYEIEYSDFISYPTKVDELGIFLSSVEHSTVAKDIALASEYNPAASEYASDFGSVDPRLVFEVKDPYNYWEQLYINVLGQTIVVRCGHRNQLIADLDGGKIDENKRPTLTCYLRYPTNSAYSDNNTVTAFSMDLSDLSRQIPYQLPSGDVLCIADSLESLQVVLSKKHNGVSLANVVRPSNVISKEVHEQLMQALQDKADREAKNAAETLKTIKIEHATEVAALNSKLSNAQMTIESLKTQVAQWSSLNEATSKRQEWELSKATKREALEAKREERLFEEKKHDWENWKLGIGIASTVLTFATALYLKHNK